MLIEIVSSLRLHILKYQGKGQLLKTRFLLSCGFYANALSHPAALFLSLRKATPFSLSMKKWCLLLYLSAMQSFFIHPLQFLEWQKLRIPVTLLEPMKQTLLCIALSARAEGKLEDTREEWQGKGKEVEEEPPESIWQLRALCRKKALMTSLLNNFKVEWIRLHSQCRKVVQMLKTIQQTLPNLFFISYLVVKV